MIRLGEIQELQIVKEVEFGVYLGSQDEGEEEKVLLPKKQVPENHDIGDLVKVFIYKDSGDRLIATTREPVITLGEVKTLRVNQVNKMGAFLDWGLEKELFLPFKEQTKKVSEGEKWPVSLYIDKSERLCATMKIYHYLGSDSPYRKNDMVEGIVYEISNNFGAFVAVDHMFSALIPKKEFYGTVQVGDVVKARVADVKADGKLELSIREKAHLQISIDAEVIMKAIEGQNGSLPFTDKASSDLIRSEMQMSKNEFKRAVGHLLKEGRIKITDKSIDKIH